MEILHFDTFADNATYNNGSSCYDTTFKLSNPIKGIKKVFLKSLEMPIVFDNVRIANGSNRLTVTVNNVPYTYSLQPKSYNDITSLINDINALFANNNIVLSVNSSNYISITVPSNSTVSIGESILANIMLGFPVKQTYTNVTTITAPNKFSLAYDNYISLYLDIPSKGSSSGSRLISYKIPLNALSGMVFYLGDNNTFTQFFEVADPNYVLSHFRIIVYDRFGFAINTGLDYTFTLAFQFI